MSELENPVTTILRLLKTKVSVIRNNASVASILYSPEHYDREFMKTYDAVVTLGLESEDINKVNLASTIRWRMIYLRCLIHTVDRTIQIDPAREMRDKTLAGILAVIQANRNLPYQTIYNFDGLGYYSTTHKAYEGADATELAPNSTVWTELSVADYQHFWTSNNDRHTKSTTSNTKYSQFLFSFKVGKNTTSTTISELEAREQCLKKLVLTFEGYGTGAQPGLTPPPTPGITFKIWDHSTSAWTHTQTGTSSAVDEVTTITLTADLINHVDANGYLHVLVRSTYPSNGSDPSSITGDFVECTLQVTGLTFCDVLSFRELNDTNAKPYLWKTELKLKGYMFETVS
ncbi:hypothetical protein MUP38_07040 [Candidatus Bathyarchaeota archaeon]|nr:hypothetical protein [Candidatus Bathyarchaeota archaeon]